MFIYQNRLPVNNNIYSKDSKTGGLSLNYYRKTITKSGRFELVGQEIIRGKKSADTACVMMRFKMRVFIILLSYINLVSSLS